MPLVRRFRGGQNLRPDRVPAVPEGDDHFGGQIFHRLAGFVRIGKLERKLANLMFGFLLIFLFFIGPGSSRDLLHGVGAAEVKRWSRFARYFVLVY